MMQGFPDFLKSSKIYSPSEIGDVVDLIKPYLSTVQGKRKLKYYNVPCAFDIESTSFYRDVGNAAEPEKCACMYVWQFGIYGCCIIGRTWDEFTNMMSQLSELLDLCGNLRLICYVHNLAFEFQFFRFRFKWDNVFSLDTRKPVYAVADNGIEFRCSYILSGYGLASLGKQLTVYKVEKLVGELDYKLPRHSKTVLTPAELQYCVNDVKVVMAYIMERIEHDGSIAKLPITKTGYVRRYCRASCCDGKWKSYHDIMNAMKLQPDEYKQLKRAFQGGFTHANPFYSGKVVEDVESYDFTSSYPAVICAEKFPMSSAEWVKITTKADFEKNLKLYCCLFDIEFVGLKPRVMYDNYISVSRCWKLKCYVSNNGRVVSADLLRTTVTEQDFMIIRQFYTWDKMSIANFKRYKKGYLPTDFVKAVLKLYADKTTLKNVEGAEQEYAAAKEMVNACYGMMVTDIVRPEIPYNEDWEEPVTPDLDKTINTYNNTPGRFLFYPWGVWVTAYARRNLFSGICEFGTDYLYSDTDSIKVIHPENHLQYIEKYNAVIRQQLYRAMDFHGIPRNAVEPMTINGVKKCLGVWDFDGSYKRFKTLGAKRYFVQYAADPRNEKKKQGQYQMTVAGLNKQVCVPYLLKKYGAGVFDSFTDDLEIPAQYTGKNTHTYIDTRRTGSIVDYMGVPGVYDELSGVHLDESEYSLSLSREYIRYIMDIENNYY